MKRIIWVILAVAVFLTVKVSFAQDPLEVGPHVYKFAFENERVRVMNLDLKPGDKIATHSHPDHFVYVLSGGKLLLSYPDGSTKDFEGKAGDVIWINAETHAAENVGDTELKAVIVELKNPVPAADSGDPAATEKPAQK